MGNFDSWRAEDEISVCRVGGKEIHPAMLQTCGGSRRQVVSSTGWSSTFRQIAGQVINSHCMLRRSAEGVVCGAKDDALEGPYCEHGRELPSYSQLLAGQYLVSLASLPYVYTFFAHIHVEHSCSWCLPRCPGGCLT